MAPDRSHTDSTREARLLLTLLERCDHSLQRMGKLLKDVPDKTRVPPGWLTLRLEPGDLAGVVGGEGLEPPTFCV